jgi:hypothetical protein
VAFASAMALGVYENLDLKRTQVVDNLWDGINEDNELQVHSDAVGILVEGFRLQTHEFGAAPRVGDIDGDGRPELVVADGNGFVWVYPLGPPNNNRQIKPATFVRTFCGDEATLALADVTGDGLNDAIVGNMLGVVGFLRNRGKGEFTDRDMTPSMYDVSNAMPLVQLDRKTFDIGSFSTPYVIDWDRDGKLDLLCGEGSYSANSVYLFRNRGSSSNFQLSKDDRYWLIYGLGKEHLSPAVGDLNGDGHYDMIVGDRLGNLTLYLYEPDPQRAQTREKFLLTEKGPVPFADGQAFVSPLCRPELTDWDGDGKLDLLIGTQSGKILLALNVGTAKEPMFTAPVALKAPDQLKPYTAPASWRTAFSWFRQGMNPHSAAMLQMMNDVNPETGENVRHLRYSYYKGYMGARPWILFSGSMEMVLGRTYTVSMRCRGVGVSEVTITFWFGERGRKGDTLEERWPSRTVRFRPTSGWQTLRRGFKLESEVQNRVETGNPSANMRIAVMGRPDLTFDIAEMSVEAGGSITPDTPEAAEQPAQQPSTTRPAAGAARSRRNR